MPAFAPPADATILEIGPGRIVAWFPAPGIAATQIIGYANGELARRAYALTDAQSTTPHVGFTDLRETTGFDWEARGRALRWNIVHMTARMMLHILVHEPPMLLATKVFQRALEKHVEVHTTLDSFASAYQLCVRQRMRVLRSHPPPRL